VCRTPNNGLEEPGSHLSAGACGLVAERFHFLGVSGHDYDALIDSALSALQDGIALKPRLIFTAISSPP
jgi:hypothetical protein